MLKIFFAILIFIHGLIHLIGFVSACKLAKVNQFSGKVIFILPGNISKIFGAFWLIACILFIITSCLFILKKEQWWLVSIIAIIISQTLIIIYWPHAKTGTIANVIIFMVSIVAFGNYHFNQTANENIRQVFILNSLAQKEIITKDMTNPLPFPVQHWLLNCGIIGKEKIHFARLKQKGLMRTNPDQEKWMSAYAEQYFNIDDPAFIWQVKMNMMPLVPIAGMDKFEYGKGRMIIKLFSLINMVNASGLKIDQAALQRYLAEICWFPSAAISPYIRWEAIDSFSAKATMTYKSVSGDVLFYFNEKGEITRCTANRYKENTEHAPLEKWIVTTRETGVLNGIKMPLKSEVMWELEEGDFTWFKIEVTEIEYNIPYKFLK